VVAVGDLAQWALAKACGISAPKLSHAITLPDGIELRSGGRLFAACHCGRRTQNINRSPESQINDWQRIQR